MPFRRSSDQILVLIRNGICVFLAVCELPAPVWEERERARSGDRHNQCRHKTAGLLLRAAVVALCFIFTFLPFSFPAVRRKCPAAYKGHACTGKPNWSGLALLRLDLQSLMVAFRLGDHMITLDCFGAHVHTGLQSNANRWYTVTHLAIPSNFPLSVLRWSSTKLMYQCSDKVI